MSYFVLPVNYNHNKIKVYWFDYIWCPLIGMYTLLFFILENSNDRSCKMDLDFPSALAVIHKLFF